MSESAPIEILLVEDDPHDLELTLRSLQKARVANHIHVARDGVEALDFLFGEGQHAGRQMASTPRLVLLDLKLPKVDGLEVLRRIKGDARTRHVPVVVLTSSREQRDLIESYHLGVNSYIVKPVNFDRFASSVQELGLYWLVMNHVPPGGP
jgi:CheY-like chemotaxis protein